MKTAGSCVIFIAFVIGATHALSLGADADESTEINVTEFADVKSFIARRKAYRAFVLISPFARNDCLDTFQVPNDTFPANELMDMAMEYVRELIRNNNMDRVEIPNFSEGFTQNIGIGKVKGSFEGRDGWLESTVSIARKGDANVRLNGTAVMLDSTLGLNVLRLGMDYNAKVSFIRVKGHMDAKVRSNAVSFSGGLDYTSGTCRLFLRSLTLSELGKIDVHVTGLGKLNWLYSKIVTWVTSRLHNKIKDTIENKLRAILEKELGKIKCPIPLSY